MESSLSDSLRKALECRICSEEFRDPRMLPCLHTFCLGCLEKIGHGRQPGENIPCSFCQKQFQLPDNGIKGIPRNLFLEKLVELYHSSFLIKIHSKCDLCSQEDGVHVATVFCMECDQNICEFCSRLHKKTKSLKDHQVYYLKDKKLLEQTRQASKRFCERHANQQIELYCFDCDEVLCKLCHSYNHGEHKCLNVEIVRSDFKTQLRIISDKISEYLKESDTVASSLQDRSTVLVANVNELKIGVEEQTRLVMSIIKQESDKVMRGIESIHSADTQNIQVRKEEIGRQIAIVQKFEKKVSEIIENGSDVDIGQTYVKLKEEADGLEKNHLSLRSSSDVLHSPSSAVFAPFAFDKYIAKSRDNVIGRVSKPSPPGCNAIASQVLHTEAGSAKCLRFTDVNFKKPTHRVVLKLPCNCLEQSDGNNIAVQYWWVCVDCGCVLEYAFDEYFYCKCGRAGWVNFQFKCNRSNHGGKFETFQPEYIQKMLGRIESKKEINILLLGGTGVGKSTWINSILNYMTFPSLDEAAKSGKLLNVIGGSFVIASDDFELKKVNIGDDANEIHSTGQSTTQYPKSYLFEQETRLVRFIDTPGISGAYGFEKDKKNFKNILKYLANFDKLNGICILWNPTSFEHDFFSRYCLQEIFTNFHKDAIGNVVFCFTNARNNFYKPDDALSTLKILLGEKVDIPLTQNNVFCLDNEAFRFLCAQRGGISFDVNDIMNFIDSWGKSAAETSRMIDYVAGLRPHSLTHTISLNNIRKYIVSLKKPVTRIADFIQVNMYLIKVKDEEKRITSYKKANLESERTKLQSLKTVCTDHYRSSYGESYYLANKNKDCSYTCHNPCLCTSPATIDKGVSICSVLKSGRCSICGCGTEKHKHVEFIPEQHLDKYKTVQSDIQSNAVQEEQLSKLLESLRIQMKELEEEQRVIKDASVKFRCYLKANVIALYNNALAEYLKMLIDQEDARVNVRFVGGDGKVLKRLKGIKESYCSEVEAFEKLIQTDQKPALLGPAEVKQLVQMLGDLKETGKMLRETLESSDGGNQKLMTLNETIKLA